MTRLALLWHMHQPFCVDPVTGASVLPWVRRHATKDYRGMVDTLAPYPRVRATFNLVPSLLAQLQAYADGRARDRDHAVGTAPVASLSRADRAWLVANGLPRRLRADDCPLRSLRGTARTATPAGRGVAGRRSARSPGLAPSGLAGPRLDRG